MDDPYDYTPVPLRPTHTVRCTYRHVGRGKPMPYQLEKPPMIRLTLFRRLIHSPVGTVLLWLLVALGALIGTMCLTALRVGR